MTGYTCFVCELWAVRSLWFICQTRQCHDFVSITRVIFSGSNPYCFRREITRSSSEIHVLTRPKFFNQLKLLLEPTKRKSVHKLVDQADPKTKSSKNQQSTMAIPELFWLRPHPNFPDGLQSVGNTSDEESWNALLQLANSRLDMVATTRLDRRLLRACGEIPPPGLQTKPIRLAVLGSSSVDHLHSGIRVGGLRRGLWVTIHKSPYGQYFQDLNDPSSDLRRWNPDVVLLSLDAHHLFNGFAITESTAEIEAGLDRLLNRLVHCWRIARDAMGCKVIQQTALPIFPNLFGNNEQRLAGSPANLVERFNERLRSLADAENVDLLAIDRKVAVDGISGWYDSILWHRAKQEIYLAATPVYGDLVGRLLAAQQGRSAKCLVLDLDNTLWGGVIGDDGLDGIVLGQGSARGEAFVDFQRYAKNLSQRGIILAVCSKNDEANALAPFEKHAEMVLKRSDIACFAASWQDKASAIRNIAAQLNIGLDSLVFADDNPFEREIVRRELPMVSVPELPEDPSLYAATIAQAGYFEALYLTADDIERTKQYQANLLRDSFKATTTDVTGYLESLDMKIRWSRFRPMDRQRIAQLINKTNQFNLTTRRYNEDEVDAATHRADMLTLQVRLIDQFGDNGIISLVIARPIEGTRDLEIDTWLMSCRVLGRQAEQAVLNLLMSEASRLGATRVVGRYRSSAKNGMVADHYPKLGFTEISGDNDADLLWQQAVDTFIPHKTFIHTEEA